MLALAGAAVLLLLLGLGARLPAESPVTAVPDLAPRTVPAPTPAAPPAPPPLPPGAPPQPPSETAQAVGDVLVGLLVVVGVALLVLVLLLVARVVARRPPLPEGIDDTEPAVVDLAEVEELLRRSRSEIDLDGDVNRAVVSCWRGLEALAADAGVPRGASQTAREYVVAVLTDAQLPQGPAERLADLYEAALFAGTRLPETSRTAALDALAELRRAAAQGSSR